MGARVDSFWAEYFGIGVADLKTPGLSIVRHVGLGDYRGVWFFLHGARLVVSAPEPWRAHLRSVLVRARLPTPAEVVEIFGGSVERTIGPTFQGALEAPDFRPFPAAHVRTLLDADADAIAELRAACDADDWSDAAMDKAVSFRAGAFDDGRIVALAGFRPWSGAVGDLCVLTRPGHRGRGHAKAAVSRVMAAALADDRVLLYQTLEANVAAVRIALALGCARYSCRLAVRLTTEVPPA